MQFTVEHVLPPGDSTRLYKMLEEIDGILIPPLSQRVNIKEYAQKVNTHADLFYAMEGNTDCGCCAVYMNDMFNGFITSLAVLPKAQYNGVGSMLLENVFRTAKEKGLLQIGLQVNLNNFKALNFYTKNGFIEIEIKNDWVQMLYKI